MTASRKAAHWTDALRALDPILGWAGGIIPVHIHDGLPRRVWHTPGHPERLVKRVRNLDQSASAEVALGLPWRDRNAGGVTHSTVLWVRIEGGKQFERARRFRPLPTLALQEGASSRRLLLWALEEPLDWFDTKRLCKRVAYRIGAVQKWSDPDVLRVPCPGSFLRRRSRPVAVVASRLTDATYRAEAVAGRLPDPPEVVWENGKPVVKRAQGGFR